MESIERFVERAAGSLAGYRSCLMALTACEIALESLGLDAAPHDQVVRQALRADPDEPAVQAAATASSQGNLVEIARVRLLRDFLRSSQSLGLLRESSRVEVVANASENWPSLRVAGAADIWSSLKRLLAQAKEEFIFASPFMTEQGVAYIAADMGASAARGIRCTLVTTHGPDRPVPRAPEGVRLVAYDEKDKWFHAKLAGIDQGASVYLGSANMTDKGFYESFEVGIILEGRAARDLWPVLAGMARGEG